MATKPTAQAQGPTPDDGSAPGNMFELVTRALNVAYYEWLPATDEIHFSPALRDLWGHDPGTWTWQRAWDTIHPDDQPGYRAARIAYLKSDAQRAEFTYRARMASGEHRWQRDQAIVERDAAGRVTRLVGAIFDITEARQHEADLQAANATLAARGAENRALVARQAASIEVLKTISASPDDPQPVFDLIARCARELCGAETVSITEYDGTLLHTRVMEGFDPAATERMRQAYPRRPEPNSMHGRALLSGETIHARDLSTDTQLSQLVRDLRVSSRLTVPLRREAQVIGVLSLGRLEPGGFDDAEVAVVESFAEQASLAIAGAATVRELRARTGDLQESLEFQTATGDVLKVISRSTFDLQPVLDTVVETTARLCDAEQAVIYHREGELMRLGSNFGFPPEYEANQRALGAFPIRPDAVNVGMRTAHEGRIVHIPDVAAVLGYPDFAIRLGKQRTALGVPLLRENEVIGIILLARQRVEPFTDRQIELVSTFADQAVIAIENTRLITEQREALEQQTATSEVLQVINASPGDLAPVFTKMLEEATRLCEAAFGELWGDKPDRPVALLNVPAAYAEFRARVDYTPGPGTFGARFAAGEHVVHIVDLADTDAYRDHDPGRRAMVDLGGARSALAVALRKDDVTRGIIVIYRQEIRPFSDRQIALLENFAAQAVIAMENARLLCELQERTAALAQRNSEYGERIEQQVATIDVLKVMSASPGDAQPVFELIAERARAFCEADGAAVALLEDDGLHLRTHRGYADSSRQKFEARFPLAIDTSSIMGRTILAREAVQVPDIRTDHGHIASINNAVDMRSVVGVPMLRAGAPIGAIALGRCAPGDFSATQIELLKTFAEQAVIAIGSAETFRALQERTAALAERNSEYGEKIEHQSATIDVLKAMSASPGDPQPVFEMIAKRARELCGSAASGLFEFDGELLHLRTWGGYDPVAAQSYVKMFPMKPDLGTANGRAILERRIVHVPNVAADPDLSPTVRAMGVGSTIAVPLLRDGQSLGTIAIGQPTPGGFSDSQVELLKTFAEQAVIAISSAETYRALQERTAALAQRNNEYGERIEQQAATIDVLKVMSSTPDDTQPVFELITERARQLCGSLASMLFEFDGELLHLRAWGGYDAAAAERYVRQFPMRPDRGTAAGRAMVERRIIHIRDIAQDPEISAAVREMGVGSTIAVPLLRDGQPIGVIAIGLPIPGGFSDSQIALLQTFAEQAVIAMASVGNFRALQERTAALAERNSEYGERIEQQAATIDVLKVMSGSPDDTQSVFAQIVRRAKELCNGSGAALFQFDGELVHIRASDVDNYDPASPASGAYWAAFPMPPNHVSITCRAILDKQVIHVRDVEADPELSEVVRQHVQGWSRSQLSIPLLRDGQALGAITLASRNTGGFSDSQAALLQTFAEQAVIAITSAETYRELQERTAALAQRNSEFGERIEQQSATIDVLKVMSSTPDDTQPVFELIAMRARELCGAHASLLFEFDGELLHLRTWGGYDPAAAQSFVRQFPMRPDRGTAAGRAILDRQIIHIRETAKDPEIGRAVLTMGVGSTIAVPLLRDGQPIGAFAIGLTTAGGFSDSQVALFQTFAEQAVIAITSVANFRALRERTEALARSVAELQALEEVLRAVNSSLDLDTVLSTIISRAVRLSKADEGTIYEFDEAEEVFVPKSAYGMTEERVEALRERRIRIGETPLGISAANRAPLHIDDLAQTPDASGARELVRDGIHALLVVPLLRDETVVGGLVIRRRQEGGFPPTTVTLLQTFAGQSVLAIENARLFQELATRGEEARRARIAAEAALSDLRRTQDRLVQTEKLASLGQLTAGIAHEIKNPLNFVNNFSDLSVDLLDELHAAVAPDKLDVAPELRAEIDDITTTLKGNLERIAQHGRRADSIVKNMLLHSRSGPSEHRTIDLNTTVEEALNLAFHGARAATQDFNITMERDLDPSAGTIDAFPQEFIRVMLNLINNGFYAAHMRAKQTNNPGFEPTLCLTTHDLGDQVEIRVRDNGTGIPQDVREKIFEPFFTTKPAGEGTGLGLSLSHDIVVKQHNGQLTVDSQIDNFTEFTIILPRWMAAGDGGRA